MMARVPFSAFVALGLSAVAPLAGAATVQNFSSAGTAYVSSTCAGNTAPQVLGGGPGGTGNFLRLVPAGAMNSQTSIAFQASDRGGFTQIQAAFDFRLTPESPTSRADGFGVALLNTAVNDTTGGTCLSSEEANVPGALGIGFDIFNNAEIDNNHVSVHFNNATLTAVSATSVTDLGSGQWIHARIVVRPGGGLSNVSVFLTPTGGTEKTLINNLAVPGLAPYESRVYFSARTGGQTAAHDIANVNVTYSGDPAFVGSWSGISGLPVVPIHSIMMPSQKILFWDRASANTDINPRLFNTLDGTVTSTANPVVELFCSGHSLDAQGRVLIFGGHDGSDGFGLHTAFAYESPANIFRALPDMNAGRWYPNNTALGNGDTLVVSGSSTPGTVNQLPQVFQDKTQTWRSLTSANNNFPLYPMMIAAPDGRVFNAGPNADTKFLTVTGTGAWSAPITNIYGSHDYGSAVLYDEGKLVVIGGGFTTNGVEAIDLKAATPVWTARTSMAFPRRQSNAVILADGNILVTGGSKTPVFNSAAGAIFASEIYDPLANTWSMGAAMAVARLYHSETLLYADGRVVSRGGGHPAADAGGTDNFNQEIYSPPYLYKGARPSVTAAPTSAANGQTIFIQTPDGAGITKAHLIRLNAVTHSFDQNQRIIRLAFTNVTGGLNAVIPASSNVALPGHYWLFIVNGNGVPSIGRVISVQRPYQQSTASDGIVSIEVERFHDSVTQGGHTWNRTTTSGNSGSGALASQPNNGANVNTGFAAGAPRVDFWVNFTKTGTHYVWLRGLGATGDDDSAHVGLDGVENTTADRISSFGSGLNWTKATMDGPVATVNVSSAGLRRVSIWMREDGLVLDKLLLTTNSAFTPTGAGPAESAPY